MKSIWITAGDSYPKRNDRVLVKWYPSKHRTSSPDIRIAFYKEGWYAANERKYIKLDNVVSWREMPV